MLNAPYVSDYLNLPRRTLAMATADAGKVTPRQLEQWMHEIFPQRAAASLAEALGVSEVTIYNYLKGPGMGGSRIPVPTQKLLALLLDAKRASDVSGQMSEVKQETDSPGIQS